MGSYPSHNQLEASRCFSAPLAPLLELKGKCIVFNHGWEPVIPSLHVVKVRNLRSLSRRAPSK